MRYAFLAAVFAITATGAAALDIEQQARFGRDDATRTLDIISTADIAFFAPVIESFLTENTDVSVNYIVASSGQVMAAASAAEAAYDIVISSAMDLQTKLANDGRAQVYRSEATARLPDWAVWNDMVFAFTQEPAAVVMAKDAFPPGQVPTNRQELLATLRENPERFRGKVGTYDVRQSGLGYLFATQDARSSDTYWRLTEVLGSLDVKLFCCSSDMLDEIRRGTLDIAYNVLGSYVEGRPDRDAFTLVLPQDFTTLMLRTVLIPTTAPEPETARRFVDHILDLSLASGDLGLVALPSGTVMDESRLRRIALGPELLVYLDRFKRRAFIEEWESAILQ